jgi:hypothetical protein
MACDRCPCPATCPGLAHHCQWVLADPIDPVHIRTICRDRTKVSVAQQARNFAGAIGRSVVAAVTGNVVFCTPDQESERESICFHCDKLVNGTCILCGCQYRKKIRLATERCPIGKWERIKAS